MPNFDRGIVKWMPFNSVVSSKKMLFEIQKKKNIEKMPLLSEEQQYTIEKKLLEAFYEKQTIHISYYENNKILFITGNIKKIDNVYHKIYLNSKIIIFEQIIAIS